MNFQYELEQVDNPVTYGRQALWREICSLREQDANSAVIPSNVRLCVYRNTTEVMANEISTYWNLIQGQLQANGPNERDANQQDQEMNDIANDDNNNENEQQPQEPAVPLSIHYDVSMSCPSHGITRENVNRQLDAGLDTAIAIATGNYYANRPRVGNVEIDLSGCSGPKREKSMPPLPTEPEKRAMWIARKHTQLNRYANTTASQSRSQHLVLTVDITKLAHPNNQRNQYSCTFHGDIFNGGAIEEQKEILCRSIGDFVKAAVEIEKRRRMNNINGIRLQINNLIANQGNMNNVEYVEQLTALSRRQQLLLATVQVEENNSDLEDIGIENVE